MENWNVFLFGKFVARLQYNKGADEQEIKDFLAVDGVTVEKEA